MSEQDAVKPLEPAGEKAGRRWDLLLMALVWLPLICLYIWALDRFPFQDGEYRTLYDVRESIPVLLADRLKHAHQPLFFLVAWVFARIFGTDSIFAMRILPQSASFVALGFLYATVRTLAGKYAAALAVSLCLLANAYMWIGHNIRPASFLVMFVMAATYFIVSAGDTPRLWRRVLIGLLAFLALFSYNAAIPVVAIMMIGVLFIGPARWRLFFPLLIAIAVFIPWFIYTMTWYEVEDRLGWLTPGGVMHWPAAILKFTYNVNLLGTSQAGTWWAITAVSLVWLVHLGLIIYGFSRVRRYGVLLGLMWFFPLICGLFSLVVLNVNTMQTERYFAMTVMCQAIGLAIALTSLPVRLGWLRPAVCGVVMAAALAGLGKQLNDPVPVREMDFVEYLRDHAPDADMVYICQFARLKYQIEYYDDDVEVYMLPLVYGIEPGRAIDKYGIESVQVGQPMAPMPHEDADELVVIEYLDEMDPDPVRAVLPATQELRDTLDELIASYDQVEIIELESGTVYHLRR